MRRRCAAALAVLGAVSEASNCLAQGFCNGHGTCVTDQDYCECYEGWGAKTDVATTRNHDCSQRTCPGGPAWADVPTEVDTAHALAECSAKGDCERVTGTCMCYPGFSGAACERYGCGNECSGHGKCLPMKRIAKLKDALPLSPGANTYTGKASTTRWDQDRIYGCVCDSSWDVGLLDGQRQEPEWFSHDCSLRHCPLGDDPYTPYVDETDCSNVTARYGHGVGETGNICQVDCANRGKWTYCSAATLRRARAPTTVPGSSSPTDPDMSARYTRSLANDCCAAFHRRTRGRTRFARQRPPGTKRSSRRRGFGEARRTGASKTPGPRSTPPSANFWASRLRWWRSGASPTRSRPTARGDSSTRPKTARSAGPPFGQTTARGGASKTFATLARCDDGRRAHRPRRRRRPRATLRRRRGRCSRCSRCSLWSSRPRFAGASRTRTRRRRRRASPTHGRRADCPYKSADVPTLTLDRHRRVQRRRSRPARPEKRRRGPAAPCCVAYSPDGRKCRRRNTSQSQLSDSPDLLRLLFRAARSPRRPSQLFRVVHGAA